MKLNEEYLCVYICVHVPMCVSVCPVQHHGDYINT